MKNFRRSLRYLLPYKGRLILSVFCVFLITVLWAGGLVVHLVLVLRLRPQATEGPSS